MFNPTDADLTLLAQEQGVKRNRDEHIKGKIKDFSALQEEYVRLRYAVPEEVWYDSEYDPFVDVSLENYVEALQNGSLLDPLPSGYTSVRDLCEQYSYPVERILGQIGPKELADIQYVYDYQFESYVAPEDKGQLCAYLNDHGSK